MAKVKVSIWSTCPECEKKVKTVNLERHLIKVHGSGDAGIIKLGKRRPRETVRFPWAKMIIGMISVIVIVISSIYVYQLYKSESGAPGFNIDRTSHDYGIIGSGKFTTTFTIDNEGDADLIIYNASTSCDCTMAVFGYKGQSSPTFKLTNNPEYKLRIHPGESANLTVTLDTDLFAASGPIYRMVQFNTNDSEYRMVTIILTANVNR